MNDSKDMQIKTLVRFILYFVTFTAVILALLWLFGRVSFDMMIKKNGIVDWLDFLCLGLSSLFLFLGGRRSSPHAAFLRIMWLVPLIGLVREWDFVFDHIFHGAWKIPAGIIAGITIYKIFKSPRCLGDQCLAVVRTHQGAMLGLGFFITVIFSQLSGQQVVWRLMLGEHYVREAGRFVEEWLEFLGFVIIMLGSLEYYLASQSRPAPAPKRLFRRYLPINKKVP